jgi:hypothetical protein
MTRFVLGRLDLPVCMKHESAGKTFQTSLELGGLRGVLFPVQLDGEVLLVLAAEENPD